MVWYGSDVSDADVIWSEYKWMSGVVSKWCDMISVRDYARLIRDPQHEGNLGFWIPLPATNQVPQEGP